MQLRICTSVSDANISKIFADSKIIQISRRAGTTPREIPLRQPFEFRTEHVRELSSSRPRALIFTVSRAVGGRRLFAERLARGGVLSRNFAGEWERDGERQRKEKGEGTKRKKERKKNARLTRVCHTNQREIRALARRARAACESRSCIAVDHLVFAAMSNWPGCSGFAEISPAVQRGMVRWREISRRRRFAREACARRHCATWGTPVAPLAPSALRPRATRMEPSFSQVIGRMNRDRPICVRAYARRWRMPVRDGCDYRVMELYSYRDCRTRLRKFVR